MKTACAAIATFAILAPNHESHDTSVATLAPSSAQETEDAVYSGLRWLARHQSKDGSWGRSTGVCSCIAAKPVSKVALRDPEVEKKVKPLMAAWASEDPSERDKATAAVAALGDPVEPYLEDALAAKDVEVRARARSLLEKLRGRREQHDLETTAMALLAFLGAGYSHLSKDTYDGICFGDVIRSGLQWLMQSQNLEGAVGPAPAEGLYAGNAIAAMALSEAYGLTGSNLFKDQALKAIDWVVARQMKGGGWGPGRPDKMATFWSVLALESARISDLGIASRQIESGVGWLKVQADTGKELDVAAYVYCASLPKVRPDVAEYADRLLRVKASDADPLLLHLISYALYLTDGPSGPRWKGWYEGLKNAVVKTQFIRGCERGSWGDGTTRLGDTILNQLTLEVYYRYANVFGRWR